MGKNFNDSAIFQNLVRSDKLMNHLKTYNYGSAILPDDDIRSSLNLVVHKMRYPSQPLIADMYDRGKIIFINSRELNLPSFMTVLPLAQGNNIRYLVDCTRYYSQNHGVKANTLYGLMQNASILEAFNNNYSQIVANSQFAQFSCLAYSLMGVKVLDKIYSVSVDHIESDFIAFILAKFFLFNHLDRKESSQTNDIAYSACLNGTSKDLILQKEEEFKAVVNGQNIYEDVITLFNCINKLHKHKVKFRTFFENWVSMYGDGSTLAIDHTPSFYQVIFSSQVGAGLVKDFIIEKVVSRNLLTKIFSIFTRIY